jgi:hypothetical protein
MVVGISVVIEVYFPEARVAEVAGLPTTVTHPEVVDELLTVTAPQLVVAAV